MTATRAPSLTFGCAHADVAEERKSVEHAFLVLALGSHAVGLDETHGQHAGVVVLFQVVPGDVLADFDVGLDRHPELDEALDLAIEHVLRKHPVRNAAAIESAGFRRFLKDRHFVAEARKLVGGAVAGGTRADDGDFLAVRLAGLDHVVRQCLSEIAEKPLDRANRDGLIVLSTVAGLLARVIAHSAGDRREGHVFLDERVGVQILAALHQVEIALDLLVGSASVVARWQLVPVHRPDRSPVAGGKQVLPFFLRRCGRDAGERDLEPVGDACAFGRHCGS